VPRNGFPGTEADDVETLGVGTHITGGFRSA
jgi:hypothetical protein